MFRILVAVVLMMVPAGSLAQITSADKLSQGFILIVKDKSGLSSTESPLYLASNWGGWAPGDNAYKLSARSDMRWQIILKPPANDPPPLEFKITRGSWEQCEVAADLSDISNRRLDNIDISNTPAGQMPTVAIEVEKFSDQRPDAQARKAVSPYRTIQATGTVKRLTVVGGGVPGLFRDALVWLPPGYEELANADRRYPVLYMQDGQNLFEKLPNVHGEWRADETAMELIRSRKMEPIIIVGIPHAGAHRIAEYLPTGGIGEFKPRGDAYISFVISEVVPRVERTFRVAPGAENRAIGGSSLGGLISLYAATRHPEVFGKVLAESPSLVLGKRDLSKKFFESVERWPKRIFLGMGGKETNNAEVNAALLASVRTLYNQMQTAGVSESNRTLLIDEEAPHNEDAWAKRLPEALKALFPLKRGE